MWVASEPCSGSVMPNANPRVPSSSFVDPLRLLLLAAVMEHQQQADVVADDRVLVLQVVVQTEPLAGEVLADHRHPEVRAVLAAVLPWERVPVVAGRVRPAAHLDEQRLPLLVRETAPVPVRPSVLPPVVEEPAVVVPGLRAA